MKTLLILLAGALASCVNFTRGDAVQLGASLATASLKLAARAASGETLNLKREVAVIGLELAGAAVAKIEYNVMTPATSSTAVVSSSANVARAIIAKEAPTPALEAAATAIATHPTPPPKNLELAK